MYFSAFVPCNHQQGDNTVLELVMDVFEEVLFEISQNCSLDFSQYGPY